MLFHGPFCHHFNLIILVAGAEVWGLSTLGFRHDNMVLAVGREASRKIQDFIPQEGIGSAKPRPKQFHPENGVS